VIVLLAAVQASREVRAREIAVLRTWALAPLLYAGLAVEFGLVGLIAGTVARQVRWRRVAVSEAYSACPGPESWLLPVRARRARVGTRAARRAPPGRRPPSWCCAR